MTQKAFRLFLVFGLAIASQLSFGVEEGFTPLFNGRNLEGWAVEYGYPSDVRIKDGVLFSPADNHYPWWIRSEKQYENFDLRFEFRMDGWCNSGILYHAPLHGRLSRVGFEYQIDHKQPHEEAPSIKTSGAIFDQVAPTKNNLNDDKEWNSGRIVVDWPRIQHYVNGMKVVDINAEELEALKHRLRTGYIGIQGMGYDVWLRNIRIKELPAQEEWIPLYNGKDLSGWHIEGKGAYWSAEPGYIHAEDGTNYLVTDDEFEDFVFNTYIRTSSNANGGIFVRWNTLKGGDRGNEIQIENAPDSNYPTGSLYNIIRAKQPPFTDDEWFPMQIYLNGSHLVVRVNGETTVDTHDFPTVRSGHISLQMHSHGDYIDFKHMKIKRLD